MASCKAEYRSPCARPALTASGRYKRISATFTRAKRCARRCNWRSAALSCPNPERDWRARHRLPARCAPNPAAGRGLACPCGRGRCRASMDRGGRLGQQLQRRAIDRAGGVQHADRGLIHRQREQVRFIAGRVSEGFHHGRRYLRGGAKRHHRLARFDGAGKSGRFGCVKSDVAKARGGFARGAAQTLSGDRILVDVKNGASVGEGDRGVAQDGGNLGEGGGLAQAPHGLIQMFGQGPLRRLARWWKRALPFPFGTTAPARRISLRKEGEGAAVDILERF
jgi:hypothetical protein